MFYDRSDFDANIFLRALTKIYEKRYRVATVHKSQATGFSYMLVGYMRVSSESNRQTTNLQRDALSAVGVDSRHLFKDHVSGAKNDRAGLAEALSFVQPSDVLVVWKLDRLGRALSHSLSIVNTYAERKESDISFAHRSNGYHVRFRRTVVSHIRRSGSV